MKRSSLIIVGLVLTSLVGVAVAAPGIALTPSPLAFGDVHVGSTADQALVISSTGTSDLTVTGMTITGAGAAQFSLTDHGCSGQACTLGTPIVLAPGTFENVVVRCAPTTAGTTTATLTVASDASAAGSVTLSCTGTRPDIDVTAGSLAFGTVTVGQTPQLAFQIQNTATGTGSEPLDYTIATTGAGAAAFSVSPPCTTTCTVPAGGMTTVTVTFAPGTAVAYAATLTITSDDPAEPTVTVDLTGTGTGAVFTTAPSSLDFGTVAVGTFAEQTVTITNTGDQPATVQSIASGDSAFTFMVTGGAAPRTLAPAESIEVVVRFTPLTGAVISTDLTITTDGFPPTSTVPLVGDGLFRDVSIAIQDEADAMVDLGAVRVGTTVSRLVTVTNIGETSVTLSMPTSDDAHCAIQLGTPATLPATLAPAAAATFEIRTTPTAVGPGACTITIATDIPTTDTIAIDYSGIAPDVALVTPTSGAIAFGVVDIDAPMEVGSVVVRNTGSDVLVIGSCTLTGSSRFSLLTDCSQLAPLALQATATITVAFDPTIEASEAAQLAVGVDAISTSAVLVNLSGTGGDQRIDVSPLVVSFPDTVVDPTPPPNVRITVRNPIELATGTGSPLAISMVMTDDAVFERTNPGPFTIDPGGELELAVLFRPIVPGTYEGSLILVNDTTGSPMAAVALNGRGLADPATEGGGCCQSHGSAPSWPLVFAVLLVLGRRRRRARHGGRAGTSARRS